MPKTAVPTIKEIEQAQREASMLDIRLTDAYFYLRAGKMKTRLMDLTDKARDIRRALDAIHEELDEAERRAEFDLDPDEPTPEPWSEETRA